MTITEIEARSILIKHKKIDSWFLSRYGMNLYRGCQHNCVYCDGRSEKYGVEGDFGKDVSVKVNAHDVLRRELDPRRRRKPFSGGYFMLGGGVGDSYQLVEKSYQLTRNTLKLMHRFNHPVHILTKSTMVERDLDLIENIDERKRAILSFSFSSVDDPMGSKFEPGVPPPSERLEVIENFKEHGIHCGMFLLPVIPFITDDQAHIEEALQAAKDVGADFIIFGGMTLKEGRQKDYFYDALREDYPGLIEKYEEIYRGDKWGNAVSEYYKKIEARFHRISKRYDIPLRMPISLFGDLLNSNDKVVVILEHIEYLNRMAGKSSSYGRAAYEISKLQDSLEQIEDPTSIAGVGQKTASIIEEVLLTGTSKYYERLMRKG